MRPLARLRAQHNPFVVPSHPRQAHHGSLGARMTSRLALTALGPVFCAMAVTLFSLNDVVMKTLSGDYALHQLVLISSIVGMSIILLIIAPLSGGWHVLRTARPGQHLLRASFVFFANITFFLGLASLPLADCVALFFVSPFLITIFSVLFLGETVGRHRWAAVAFGFVGVLIILRPGTDAFQIAALFPIAAAFGYAGLHIMTRRMRHTDNAVAMVFSIQLFFMVTSLLIGLIIGGGQFAAQTDPALAFLFRGWSWPTQADLPLVLVVGVFASVGGWCISQAYRLGEAALVAPVEYLALPLSILWGILIFGQWPDALALTGMAMIVTSGLYTVWRDNRAATVS